MQREDDLKRPVGEFLQPVETTLRADVTIQQAIDTLRQRQIDQKVIYFYVVDEERRLLGVASAQRLVLADPSHLVGEVMERRATSVPVTATLEEAMEVFALSRLLAVPVVDERNRLLGQIDVTLYAEEAMDLGEAHRLADLFQIIGLSVQHFKQRRPLWAYVIRMPWLMCNVIGGIVCAFIAFAFQRVLSEVLLLAMFIPLVLTLSEAISMQSMTLGLPFLRTTKPMWRRLWLRTLTEWQTALLLGGTSAIIAALVASFWGHGRAAAVIAVSIVASMLSAATLGNIIPMLLHAMKMDPRVAAGPVVLMIGDIVTTAVYLGLAAWWLL